MPAVRWTLASGQPMASAIESPQPAPDELLVEQLPFSLGATPGIVGRVVGVGAERAREAEGWVGRLAVLPSQRVCGACVPCRRGHPSLCMRPSPPPALASQAVVAARLAVMLEPPTDKRVPGALSEPASWWPLAALADVGLRAYAASIRASVEPNRAAIVLGAGPLARFVAALVAHRGAVAIRVDAALSLAEAEARIASALVEHGIDAFAIPTIDTSGDRARAVALARPGSAVVLCGDADDSMLPFAPLAERELAIFGLRGAHPDLLTELVAFACAGTLELEPLCKLVDDVEDERVPVWMPSA